LDATESDWERWALSPGFFLLPLSLGAVRGHDPRIMKLTWRDSEEIAWALMDAHPDQDPLKLSFPKLHKMVCELPEFGDKPEASNEKILENIQMAWYSEQK
jgi:FeS assembly protein IscX